MAQASILLKLTVLLSLLASARCRPSPTMLSDVAHIGSPTASRTASPTPTDVPPVSLAADGPRSSSTAPGFLSFHIAAVDGSDVEDSPPPPPDMAPNTSLFSLAVAACVVAAGALAALFFFLVRGYLKRRAGVH